MEKVKTKCPYCGEEIMVVAKKCRHCGEWLHKVMSEESKKQISCPICGEDIDEELNICPYCHESVEQTNESNRPKIVENTQDSIPSKEKLVLIIVGVMIISLLFSPVISIPIIIGYTFYYRRKSLAKGSRFFNNGGLWYIAHWGDFFDGRNVCNNEISN